MHSRIHALAAGGLLLAAACASPKQETAAAPREPGAVYTVRDTVVQTAFDAAGTAAPLREATLSTKLMGSVLAVPVKEGDVVSAGQPLVRLDARDVEAKQAQVAASIAETEAMHRDATTQAGRIRALYADSAATRAQLDAVETGLARAEAAVRAAHASAAELRAVGSYAIVRAPFAGTVTRRFVDPGAFAAPGAPLLTVQDGSRLRISATATPDVARGLRAGQRIAATIEGRSVDATVEGVVPASAGNLYRINAIVANASGAVLPGSTATLSLPLGARPTLLVPAGAVRREGDLTGVTVRLADGDQRRFVRVGRETSGLVEVYAGLRAGDQVVVPPSAPATVAAARD